ncbi:TIGR03619 family F420-dependent LLM class oxidoreductase [Nonomuraea sp. K274]|uniref:TIGR03619 family F420-dependent LLM class oxidoreductase n=1 Tax=Nonomuraea cypriaca TaxID=1187855 RepID=A0A931AJA0_9ACTN|nr:TIGR03619 family F420-dependent LLM class oxidoreductase [Nonomuraea cypriaca]MBF8192943.1 TIGR03619 family F420-dependent LLM class oxidoreductase [Nonomuraea cypriaca]
MRIGFALPQSGPWATPENMRRIATRAEELGYHELWTFQRLLYPVGHTMGPTYRSVHDPLITLAHVAGATSRIRLSVAVINAYVQPVLLAKQLATLQTISGGRVTAGIGLGWLPEEFEASGVAFGGRGRRVEEFVEVLRKAWADDVVEHAGEFYRVPPSHIDPKPLPGPPPILLGGAAEPALRRAGRLADGWVSASRTDLTAIGGQVELIKAELAASGRDASAFRFACRGVTQVRAGGERRPLMGTYEQIRADVDELAASGVTDVFHDLQFDREIVTTGVKEAMSRAEEALEALAP